MVEEQRAGIGRYALLAAWLAVTAGMACSSEPSPGSPPAPAPGGEQPPPPPPEESSEGPSGCTPARAQDSSVDCSRVGRILLAGMEQDLGSGLALSLRLEGTDGEPLDAATHGQCLHVLHPISCAETSAQVHIDAHPSDGAVTALLVAPGASPESAARARAVVEAFLAARPAQERIAIFRWGESVRQVSDFTRDRDLAKRLARRGLVEATEKPLLPAEALTGIRTMLGALSRDTFTGVRDIVVVAPELTLDALPARVPGLPDALDALDASVLWGVSEGAALDRAGVVALQEDPAAAAGALSQAVSAHVDAGLVQLSLCGSGSADRLLIQPHDSPAERIVHTPEALREEGHMKCTIEALRKPRAYPDHIEFVFTNQDQRQTYYDRVEARSKDDFEVMVRLWQDGPLVAAKAKLRGMSSLECVRKSFALDFKGPAPRRFMPDSATDEIFLISMCEDDRYLNHLPGYTLLSRLGLFPLKFHFTELLIDEAHNGLYMIVEKPKDELLRDSGYLRGIVRRNADLENEAPEGKYGHINDQQALDDYAAFMTAVEQAPAGQVLETLEARMDLDQYLRWVALMTLLSNGDYSDEAYFISAESIDASLEPTDLYSIMGWDPENLFQACHHDAQYAIDDPHGLLHCAEAQIDHTIFADAEVYARYVDVLESVLDTVTREDFEALVDHTYALLDGYFQRDEVREAMVEIIEANPDAITYEGIMQDVEERRTDMKAGFQANQTRLRQAIEDWRAQQ